MTDAAASEDQVSGTRRVELILTGMSCGACARRIQSRLNKVDGVRASVDFSRRIAAVDAVCAVSVSDLCQVVEEAGYGAQPRSTADGGPEPVGSDEPEQEAVGPVTAVMRWLTRGHR